ncbi:MAG: dynamin family protein [Chitinispirillaceae bacterium]|nr:dynamin family protein [Chitinispirillaceae bacterium]
MSKGRLHLAVVGEFNRGKSTFINALIGDKILPTSVLPVTSIPTKILYGDSPACIVRFLKNKPPLIITQSKKEVVEILGQYATEQNNPKNQFAVSSIEVQYPSRILENGTVLIDTPGFGSAHIHNTMLALDSITECDAVIFLLSAESPLTHTELEFFKLLIKKIPRIFFVLNKVDLLTPSQLREVEIFIKKTLKEYLPPKEECFLFHISALLAEKNIENPQNNGWVKSGMEQIEKDILTFMSREKYFTLAQALSDKLREAIGNILSYLKKEKGELEAPLVILTNEESELSKALENMTNILTKDISEMVKEKNALTATIRGNLSKYEERIKDKIREALLLLINSSSCDRESLKNATLSLRCIIEQLFFSLRKDILFAINTSLKNTFTVHSQRMEDFLNALLKKVFPKKDDVKILEKINKIEVENLDGKEVSEYSIKIRLDLKWYEWFSTRQERIKRVHQRFDKEVKEEIHNYVVKLIDSLIIYAEEKFGHAKKILTEEYDAGLKIVRDALNKKRETIVREKEKVDKYIKNLEIRIEALNKILDKIT